MKFYDTNALLDLQGKAFENPFYISSVTLEELESIKTSCRKDPGIKYSARQVIHLLENNNNYKVVIYDTEFSQFLEEKGLELTPDNKICACAAALQDPEVVFVTGDLCCKQIANTIFGLTVETVKHNFCDHYYGYIEVNLDDEQISQLYSCPNENPWGVLVNQYLIVFDMNGNLIDKLRWTGEEFKPVRIKTIKSETFGIVKPYNGDIYQQLVLDSFANNQMTMVRGPAGTGKTWLSLGYMFYLLDKHEISKIVMFCNTPKTANSVGLG